jgi:hypothetical protein
LKVLCRDSWMAFNGEKVRRIEKESPSVLRNFRPLPSPVFFVSDRSRPRQPVGMLMKEIKEKFFKAVIFVKKFYLKSQIKTLGVIEGHKDNTRCLYIQLGGVFSGLRALFFKYNARNKIRKFAWSGLYKWEFYKK